MQMHMGVWACGYVDNFACSASMSGGKKGVIPDLSTSKGELSPSIHRVIHKVIHQKVVRKWQFSFICPLVQWPICPFFSINKRKMWARKISWADFRRPLLMRMFPEFSGT